MSFMTESRVETLLEREIRTVPGPEGEPISITAFRAFWKAYDFLIFVGAHTPERIAELARINSERLGIPYGQSFSSIVWRSNAHARRILGFDCFAVHPAT